MTTTVTNSAASSNPDYAIKTTSTVDGEVQHNIIDSSALPTGAATAALQLPDNHQVTISNAALTTTQTPLTLRYDEGATYTYIGEAAAGTLTSAASWRIKRLTNADNTIIWADGNTNQDNIYDDRASLTYS